MSELTKLQEDILDNLAQRKKYEEAQDLVAIYIVLKHTNKEEEFFKYLQKHTEQDFDELMQVAFAYVTEETE